MTTYYAVSNKVRGEAPSAITPAQESNAEMGDAEGRFETALLRGYSE
jgi:hypothetical protein